MEQEKLTDKVVANLEEQRKDKPKVNKKNVAATVKDIAKVWADKIDVCKDNIIVLRADAKKAIELKERDSIDAVTNLNRAYADIPDTLDDNAKRLKFVCRYEKGVNEAVKVADQIEKDIVTINNSLTADIQAEEKTIKLYETHIANIKELCK